MKSILLRLIVFASVILSMVGPYQTSAQPCSEAGTVSATEDSICPGGSSTLQLTAYLGSIQWQSFDGSIWVDEAGVGATTDAYQVSPSLTTDYRAVVTATGCDPDTSGIITVVVGVGAPVTTGATRCGYGPVTLSATGSGIKWYDSPSGGVPLATGTNFTTNVSSTTTFYAAASLGGGPPSPFTTTFAAGNGFDGNMFDITAINTVTIDSFAANFNAGSGTAEIWYRPGTHVGFTGSNAGWTLAGTAPYTSTGNGAPGTSIDVYVNVTIPAGQTYAFYVHGSGGISYTNGTNVGNIYSQDANIQFKEGYGGAYFSLINFPRVFNGRIMYSAGCESPRSATVATVTPATAVSVSAAPPALCQGQTSSITATSANANYNYTWSPATGLNTTTGSTVLATPLAPITYTVVADDGTCGYIDSVFISVGPASVAGSVQISTDTICLGDNATLFLNGNTGNIQWQSNNGTGWVDETGPGSTTNQYTVSPFVDLQYRAVVTSGGCDPDTTTTLGLAVLSIVDPATVGDTICGSGTANLSASGNGLLNWYTAATGGALVNTGPTYSPSVNGTTTYYVSASAGGTYNVGLPALLATAQQGLAGNDWGIQFDVIAQSTLESVTIYSGTVGGTAIINLRDAQGGPILNTVSIPVAGTATPTAVVVPLGFTLNPGTGYRLELASGSPACRYNTFGANYPHTAPGSPVTLTGSIDPAFSTGTYYYYFYNWVVTEGCKSNRVPVTAYVNPLPPTPSISPLWNTLTSSSPTGNQWYLNGVLIPGATSQTYVATQAGSYTVVVTDANGCSSTSQPVFTTGIEESLSAQGIAVYPNPFSGVIHLELAAGAGKAMFRVYDVLGHLMAEETVTGRTHELANDFPSGTYFVEIENAGTVFRKKMIKL